MTEQAQPLSAERLAEIAAELEAATGGQWRHVRGYAMLKDGPTEILIADCADGQASGTWHSNRMHANGELIADSPQAIRELLGEVERLRAEREALRTVVQAFMDHPHQHRDIADGCNILNCTVFRGGYEVLNPAYIATHGEDIPQSVIEAAIKAAAALAGPTEAGE